MAAEPCRPTPRAGALPPLSLYVHLPWCVRKCPYCDFNSYTARGALPERAYVDALLRDVEADAALAHGRAIDTIFLGGGTPSLFSGAAVRRLLEGVRARLDVAPAAEITLEANPGAIEAGRFVEFREAGVNRLSLGVQSLRDAKLAALGRVHDAAAVVAAAAAARRAGFDNLNLDLMYGLPDDDADGAVGDLAAALELAPAHLSWYQLTLEPNTAFERRPPPLPDDEAIASAEARGRALLMAAGYDRYEVSAYARSGRRCAHNLNYWRFGDYLGVGAGAHGKITLARGLLERRAKTRNPRTYLDTAGTGAAVAVERVDSTQQIAVEFLMNALRLPEGVEVDCFEQRTGVAIGSIEAPRAAAATRGWLADEPGLLKATPDGLQHLNALLGLFC